MFTTREMQDLLVTGIIPFLIVPKYSCNKATEEHKLQKPAGFDLLNPAERSGYSRTVLPGLRSAHTVCFVSCVNMRTNSDYSTVQH